MDVEPVAVLETTKRDYKTRGFPLNLYRHM